MNRDKILIIDEAGFSRVCSAILQAEGYRTEAVCQDPHKVDTDGIGLVIASYPFGVGFFGGDAGKASLPVIVLIDHISRELLLFLEGLERSLCLMKPLNYDKFLLLVKQFMNEQVLPGGYSIV